MIDDLKHQLGTLKDRKNELTKEIDTIETKILDIIYKLSSYGSLRLFFNRERLKEARVLKKSLKELINFKNEVIDNIGKLSDKIAFEINQNVYILIGIIGSGKSTWAKNKYEENKKNDVKTIIINRDQIRTMLFSKYEYSQDTEEIVRQMAWDSVRRGVECGYDIIVDECNITVTKRRQWIDYLRMNFGGNIQIIYVFCPEQERNLRFREDDLRDVSCERWKNLIEMMKRDFQTVTNEGQNRTIENKIPKIELK